MDRDVPVERHPEYIVVAIEVLRCCSPIDNISGLDVTVQVIHGVQVEKGTVLLLHIGDSAVQ